MTMCDARDYPVFIILCRIYVEFPLTDCVPLVESMKTNKSERQRPNTYTCFDTSNPVTHGVDARLGWIGLNDKF